MRLKSSCFWMLFCVCSLLYACNSEKRAVNHKPEKLNIPANLKTYRPFKKYLADSGALTESPFVVYVSLNFSCPSCIAKVDQWQSLIKKELPKNLPVIMICHSEDKFRYMRYICESGIIKNFPYPFFLDMDSEFQKNPIIVRTGETEAVLTDREHNILCSGDPLASTASKTNFLKMIENNLNPKP